MLCHFAYGSQFALKVVKISSLEKNIDKLFKSQRHKNIQFNIKKSYIGYFGYSFKYYCGLSFFIFVSLNCTAIFVIFGVKTLV